jgi:hypothetical protein
MHTRPIAGSAALLVFVLPVALVAQPSARGPGITQPAVSERLAPLESLAPVARDGHAGEGLLRKPPGDGPFPAVLVIVTAAAELVSNRNDLVFERVDE